MKKTLLYALCSIAMMGAALPAAAQQIDGDFSTWENCYPWIGSSTNDGRVETAVGAQPKGWQSSNVWGYGNGTGKNDSFVIKDGKSALIRNVFVGFSSIGAWAPGYLSIGTPWNTALVKGLGTRSSTDGGTFGGREFSHKPDAISFEYKWEKYGGKASFVGYIWRGSWEQQNVPANVAYKFGGPKESDRNHVSMKDRDANVLGKTISSSLGGEVTNTDGKLIASYEEYIDESVDVLTEKLIEFEYKDKTANPEKINIIFSSNDYFSQSVSGREKASVGDICNTLTIQNVKLVYYHSLASCKYDGADVAFDSNNSAVVIAQNYDEAKLSLVKKGVGATVEKSYDASAGLLTINVKGNDYEADKSSITTYTILFVKSEKTYTEDLHLRVFGEMQDPMQAKVLVQNRYDGKFNFVLKNFSLGEMMPVGTINVTGIERNGDTFAGNFTAHITEGDDNTKEWQLANQEIPLSMKGEFVGDDHVRVGIIIDLGEGMSVEVALGYTPYVANMTIKEGRQYGTFYAPFAVTALPEGVKAYTCSALGQDGTTLVLDELTDGIKAGTPVIVENTSENKAEASQDFYNFDEDLKTEGGQYGLLHGVAEDNKTLAPKGSYVLQTQDGGQKFYLVTDATGNLYVQANRCYLTLTSSESAVKSLAFPSGATAIDAVKGLLGGDAQIYDLEGRRLPALQKGINIVNGRKVMVK